MNKSVISRQNVHFDVLGHFKRLACFKGFVLVASLAAALLLPLTFASPSFALNDDGQGSPLAPLTTITDFIGITKKPEPPEIDYRERPSLVLPPKYELPPPQSADAGKVTVGKPNTVNTNAGNSNNWPNDPDVARRKNASVVSQTPWIFTDPSKLLSKEELMAGRSNSATPPSAVEPNECGSVSKRDCIWINPDVLRAQHQQKAEGTDNLVAGYEPPRLNLTDPPKGYRLATKSTKATVEPARPLADPANPTTIYRTDAAATGEQD